MINLDDLFQADKTAFLNNSENTNQILLSSNFGKILAKLRERYSSDIYNIEFHLAHFFKHCQLPFKTSQWLRDLLGEPLNDWDNISYLSSTLIDQKIITTSISLKESLALLFLALQDNNYWKDSSLEAKKNRLENLSIELTLAQKAVPSICHQGIRHLFCSHLEGYENFTLVQSKADFMITTLNQFLVQEFQLEKWKFQFNELIWPWLKGKEMPLQAATSIDEDFLNRLKIGIEKKILRNGGDLNDTTISPFIDATCNYEFIVSRELDFIENAPLIQKLNHWLNSYVRKNALQNITNSAEIQSLVNEMIDWLENGFQIASVQDNKKLNMALEFFSLLPKIKNLNRISEIINTTYRINLGELYQENLLFNYFYSNQEEFSIIVENIKQSLKLSQNPLFFVSEIENFFSLWFTCSKEEKATLFELLHNESFLSAVYLPDNIIDHWLKTNLPLETMEISLYEVNRIMLHALIVPLEQKTPLFQDIFKHIIDFIQNDFNVRHNSMLIDSLKRASFPPSLIKQLLFPHAELPLEEVILTPQRKCSYEDMQLAKKYIGLLPESNRHNISIFYFKKFLTELLPERKIVTLVFLTEILDIISIGYNIFIQEFPRIFDKIFSIEIDEVIEFYLASFSHMEISPTEIIYFFQMIRDKIESFNHAEHYYLLRVLSSESEIVDSLSNLFFLKVDQTNFLNFFYFLCLNLRNMSPKAISYKIEEYKSNNPLENNEKKLLDLIQGKNTKEDVFFDEWSGKGCCESLIPHLATLLLIRKEKIFLEVMNSIFHSDFNADQLSSVISFTYKHERITLGDLIVNYNQKLITKSYIETIATINPTLVTEYLCCINSESTFGYWLLKTAQMSELMLYFNIILKADLEKDSLLYLMTKGENGNTVIHDLFTIYYSEKNIEDYIDIISTSNLSDEEKIYLLSESRYYDEKEIGAVIAPFLSRISLEDNDKFEFYVTTILNNKKLHAVIKKNLINSMQDSQNLLAQLISDVKQGRNITNRIKFLINTIAETPHIESEDDKIDLLSLGNDFPSTDRTLKKMELYLSLILASSLSDMGKSCLLQGGARNNSALEKIVTMPRLGNPRSIRCFVKKIANSMLEESYKIQLLQGVNSPTIYACLEPIYIYNFKAYIASILKSSLERASKKNVLIGCYHGKPAAHVLMQTNNHAAIEYYVNLIINTKKFSVEEKVELLNPRDNEGRPALNPHQNKNFYINMVYYLDSILMSQTLSDAIKYSLLLHSYDNQSLLTRAVKQGDSLLIDILIKKAFHSSLPRDSKYSYLFSFSDEGKPLLANCLDDQWFEGVHSYITSLLELSEQEEEIFPLLEIFWQDAFQETSCVASELIIDFIKLINASSLSHNTKNKLLSRHSVQPSLRYPNGLAWFEGIIHSGADFSIIQEWLDICSLHNPVLSEVISYYIQGHSNPLALLLLSTATSSLKQEYKYIVLKIGEKLPLQIDAHLKRLSLSMEDIFSSLINFPFIEGVKSLAFDKQESVFKKVMEVVYEVNQKHPLTSPTCMQEFIPLILKVFGGNKNIAYKVLMTGVNQTSLLVNFLLNNKLEHLLTYFKTVSQCHDSDYLHLLVSDFKKKNALQSILESNHCNLQALNLYMSALLKNKTIIDSWINEELSPLHLFFEKNSYDLAKFFLSLLLESDLDQSTKEDILTSTYLGHTFLERLLLNADPNVPSILNHCIAKISDSSLPLNAKIRILSGKKNNNPPLIFSVLDKAPTINIIKYLHVIKLIAYNFKSDLLDIFFLNGQESILYTLLSHSEDKSVLIKEFVTCFINLEYDLFARNCEGVPGFFLCFSDEYFKNIEAYLKSLFKFDKIPGLFYLLQADPDGIELNNQSISPAFHWGMGLPGAGNPLVLSNFISTIIGGDVLELKEKIVLLEGKVDILTALTTFFYDYFFVSIQVFLTTILSSDLPDYEKVLLLSGWSPGGKSVLQKCLNEDSETAEMVIALFIQKIASSSLQKNDKRILLLDIRKEALLENDTYFEAEVDCKPALIENFGSYSMTNLRAYIEGVLAAPLSSKFITSLFQFQYEDKYNLLDYALQSEDKEGCSNLLHYYLPQIFFSTLSPKNKVDILSGSNFNGSTVISRYFNDKYANNLNCYLKIILALPWRDDRELITILGTSFSAGNLLYYAFCASNMNVNTAEFETEKCIRNYVSLISNARFIATDDKIILLENMVKAIIGFLLGCGKNNQPFITSYLEDIISSSLGVSVKKEFYERCNNIGNKMQIDNNGNQQDDKPLLHVLLEKKDFIRIQSFILAILISPKLEEEKELYLHSIFKEKSLLAKSFSNYSYVPFIYLFIHLISDTYFLNTNTKLRIIKGIFNNSKPILFSFFNDKYKDIYPHYLKAIMSSSLKKEDKIEIINSKFNNKTAFSNMISRFNEENACSIQFYIHFISQWSELIDDEKYHLLASFDNEQRSIGYLYLEDAYLHNYKVYIKHILRSKELTKQQRSQLIFNGPDNNHPMDSVFSNSMAKEGNPNAIKFYIRTIIKSKLIPLSYILNINTILCFMNDSFLANAQAFVEIGFETRENVGLFFAKKQDEDNYPFLGILLCNSKISAVKLISFFINKSLLHKYDLSQLLPFYAYKSSLHLGKKYKMFLNSYLDNAFFYLKALLDCKKLNYKLKYIIEYYLSKEIEKNVEVVIEEYLKAIFESNLTSPEKSSLIKITYDYKYNRNQSSKERFHVIYQIYLQKLLSFPWDQNFIDNLIRVQPKIYWSFTLVNLFNHTIMATRDLFFVKMFFGEVMKAKHLGFSEKKAILKISAEITSQKQSKDEDYITRLFLEEKYQVEYTDKTKTILQVYCSLVLQSILPSEYKTELIIALLYNLNSLTFVKNYENEFKWFVNIFNDSNLSDNEKQYFAQEYLTFVSEIYTDKEFFYKNTMKPEVFIKNNEHRLMASHARFFSNLTQTGQVNLDNKSVEDDFVSVQNSLI